MQSSTTPNWRRSRLAPWNAKPGQDAACLYGPDALRQWREDIAQAEQFSLAQRQKVFFVSWWCFDCLVDARRSAAAFLTDHLDLVPEAARPHLARAADAYRQLVRLGTQECFEQRNVFLGLSSGKKREDWTPQVRRREQEVLFQVRALDSTAIGEIDKALSALT